MPPKSGNFITAKIFTALLVLLQCATIPAQTAQAVAQKMSEQESIALITKAVNYAKTSDPVGFTHRRSMIRTSDGFKQIMDGSSRFAEEFYLDFFSASTTNAQVQQFIANTNGKHVSAVKTAQGASLRVSPVSEAFPNGYKCWQAYLASYVFFAATTMTCGAVTAMSPPAGIACAVAFWGLGTLPDFNDACK